MMSSLSAVILTLNEEENLSRCVRSLSWCDEVIVVDSGSTDATVEVAKSLGAHVFINQPDGPFDICEQRNWALDNCVANSEWVLFIDADEVITDQLVNQIRRACAGPSSIDAYQLSPKYMFWGQWMKRSMGYPNWHDRLLRPDRVRLEGGVWEHFPATAKISRISEPYLHFGNSKGFSDWLSRHDRYSNWDAQHIVAFLDGAGSDAFGTTRKLRLRRLAARFWPARPVVRFLVMYVARRGFLDGPASLVFCLRYAIYELMTIEKVVEESRRRKGLPL